MHCSRYFKNKLSISYSKFGSGISFKSRNDYAGTYFYCLTYTGSDTRPSATWQDIACTSHTSWFMTCPRDTEAKYIGMQIVKLTMTLPELNNGTANNSFQILLDLFIN